MDLTKQTITLEMNNEPVASLMKGHVDERAYVIAHHAEGWGNDGSPLSEEDIRVMAKDLEGCLVHTYCLESYNEDGEVLYSWGHKADDADTYPVTVEEIY